MSRKPRFIVLAGPNGSGKTTLSRVLRSHPWGEGCAFLNADERAQELGGWDSSEHVGRAQKEIREELTSLLSRREEVMYEPVFSHPSKVELIRQAWKMGYFVRFFFVGTMSPIINVERVNKRVSEGGHPVPQEKIVERYIRSFLNGMMAMKWAQRGYCYDNSVEDRPPELLFRCEEGRMKKVYGKSGAFQEIYRYFLEDFCETVNSSAGNAGERLKGSTSL